MNALYKPNKYLKMITAEMKVFKFSLINYSIRQLKTKFLIITIKK